MSTDMWELEQELFATFEPRRTLQPACQVHGENIYDIARYYGYSGYSTTLSYDDGTLSLRIWKPPRDDKDENAVDVTVKTGEILLIDGYRQPQGTMPYDDFRRAWEPCHEQRLRTLEKAVAALTTNPNGCGPEGSA